MRPIRLSAAALALLGARLWLRAAPGQPLRWAMRRGIPLNPECTEVGPKPDATEISCAVGGVGARLHASCLEQGVALVMLLAIARIPARLVIGVSRPEPDLRAHAWVVSGGQVVLGSAQADDFVPFPDADRSPCRG